MNNPGKPIDVEAMRGLCERRRKSDAARDAGDRAVASEAESDAMDAAELEFGVTTDACANALPSALDEVEALRARVAKLEGALRPFAIDVTDDANDEAEAVWLADDLPEGFWSSDDACPIDYDSPEPTGIKIKHIRAALWALGDES